MTPQLRRLFAATTLATICLTTMPAWAMEEVRPSGYLERGHLEGDGENMHFVPDTEGGRYFRVGGYDNMVMYGLGGTPWADWIWPNYTLKEPIRDILTVSPGAVGEMVHYNEAQDASQFFARVSWLTLAGSVLALAGGLAYDLLPKNPRQMTPSFYYATAGVAAVGLAGFTVSTLSEHQNLALLDAAIATYNHDMAGRRHLTPGPSIP